MSIPTGQLRYPLYLPCDTKRAQETEAVHSQKHGGADNLLWQFRDIVFQWLAT